MDLWCKDSVEHALTKVGLLGCGDVEEVGCVPDGLRCLTLSPDSELITLVTGWRQYYD